MSLIAKYFVEKMKSLEAENAALKARIESMQSDMRIFHDQHIKEKEVNLFMALILSKRLIGFTPIKDAKLGDCNYLVNVQKGESAISIHNYELENKFRLFVMEHNFAVEEDGGLKK